MDVMMTDFGKIVDKSPMQPNPSKRDFKGEITRTPKIFCEFEGTRRMSYGEDIGIIECKRC